MKTSWLVSIVLAVHMVAVGFILLMQGCGTPPPPAAAKPIADPFKSTESAESRFAAKPPAAFPPPVPASVLASPVSPAAKTTTYVVAKGDSLSSIANRFKVSVAEIKALNNIANPNTLKIGQKLMLPGELHVPAAAQEPRRAAAPVTGKPAAGPKEFSVKPAPVVAPAPVSDAGAVYVVKGGDALAKIAKAHGTTVAAIRGANGLKSDMIRVGQKLTIPGAGPAVPAATPVKNAFESTPSRTTPVAAPAAPAASVPAANNDLIKAPLSKEAPAKLLESSDPAALVPAPPDAGSKLAPEPALPVPDPSGAVKTHTVAADEDLYSVAMLWGVSVAEIKKLNGLADDRVAAGQKLKIPVNE